MDKNGFILLLVFIILLSFEYSNSLRGLIGHISMFLTWIPCFVLQMLQKVKENCSIYQPPLKKGWFYDNNMPIWCLSIWSRNSWYQSHTFYCVGWLMFLEFPSSKHISTNLVFTTFSMLLFFSAMMLHDNIACWPTYGNSSRALLSFHILISQFFTARIYSASSFAVRKIYLAQRNIFIL